MSKPILRWAGRAVVGVFVLLVLGGIVLSNWAAKSARL